MNDVAEIITSIVLPKLEGVRQHGPYWMARCPAHQDKVASLQVGIGTRGTPHALLHCHAGCDRALVVDTLGLAWRDLYLRSAPSHDPDPVATYSYCDAFGTVLFRKTRHLAPNGGKYFRYHAPDGRGGWKTGPGCMDGVHREIFRLPQLLAAKDSDVIVYVEGEKDAMALASIGEIATTSGGVNDWRAEYAPWFRGRDVIIVADRDKPGLEHALQVRSDLTGVARFTWIVTAHDGKDASDHIRAGYGITDFDWMDL